LLKVSVISGDGIGPEVISAAIRVVDSLGIGIEWEEVEFGQSALESYGTPLPEKTERTIRQNSVVLKGPVTNKGTITHGSPNQLIRSKFELYAQVRMGKYYEGTRSKFPNTDIVVIRECLEDLYAGQEMEIGPKAAIAIKPISWERSVKVSKFAFEFCIRNNRKKIVVGSKNKVLRLTDGMFVEAARKVSQNYPDIKLEEINIDALALHLVQKPENFDVILLQNVYGDIISGLVAGLTGGVGLAPGANFGDDVVAFEASHGSCPKYANLNKVNPTATILSAALMVDHLGYSKAAAKIKVAIENVIKEGKHVTYDLGGTAETQEMADAIIDSMCKLY